MEDGGGSQFFESLKRQGHGKNMQKKGEGHRKLSHCDHKGIL